MSVTSRLAVALRFVDAFTETLVPVALHVSIPTLNWLAVFRPPDGTYRFVTLRELPSGPFGVAVTVPGGEYVNWEPFQVSLPCATPTAPPVKAADFLVTRALWPTPRLRLPYGETAVCGRLVGGAGQSVDNLRVTLFESSGPVPASAPYARTDRDGRFLFRLPTWKRQFNGSSAVTTALLGIEVRDVSNNVLAVTPSGPREVVAGSAPPC